MPKKEIRKSPSKYSGKDVEELMAKFNYAYLAALPHFERMERINKAYGNTISEVNWPTISQVSIPLTFMAIEEQLPFAMKYLFPKNKFITLIPGYEMDRDTVKKVEDNLRYTVRTQMKCEVACFPSIKDCYKYAVGYGLVDTDIVTPPNIRTMRAMVKGKEVKKIRELGIGPGMQIPIYQYISPIQVIPMPDGPNVEGPNRASGHFVIVFVSESKLRDMYNRKGLDGKPLLQGNVEEIIEMARAMAFDYRMPTSDKIANIAGMDFTKMNNGDRKMPVTIPIVRWYEDHHHVWIANGRVKIYEAKDNYQTLRSDLVKWSAWPDGLEWYPLGVTEASERVALGENIWYNGLIDLAMYHINPVRALNTRLIDDPNKVARSPRSDIKVNGDPSQAVKYLTLPEFPGQLLALGDALQRFHANTNAITTGAQDRAPGLVRGGSNALETLLSSSTARQYLAAIMIKSGGLEPMIEKVLIKKQLIMDDEGESFVEPAYDPKTNKMFYKEETVTLDDMRQIYRVELDMPAARLNSMADAAERNNYFDRAQKNPELFDQRSLYEELVEDDGLVRRTMLPEEIVKARQERTAEASMRAKENVALPPAGQQPTSEGQQAMAGLLAGQQGQV